MPAVTQDKHKDSGQCLNGWPLWILGLFFPQCGFQGANSGFLKTILFFFRSDHVVVFRDESKPLPANFTVKEPVIEDHGKADVQDVEERADAEHETTSVTASVANIRGTYKGQ